MAKSLEQGRAKWARKMGRAGPNWKAGVSGKSGAYGEGLSQSVGAPVSPAVVSSWQEGVDAVSAEQFQQAVTGKDRKWADGFRRGVTGG